MPPELRDPQTLNMVRTTADLTVRLRVHWTSHSRPDDDDLANLRGTLDLRTGSGLITGVEAGQRSCPCFECYGQTEKFWFVYLRTARHVVFDTTEAKETKVDLFFDDENCDRDGRMKSLWGMDMEMTDAGDDFCVMRCVLHDESLALQLQEYTASAHLGMEFKMTYFTLWGRSEFLDHFIILIISHPHGKPKKVTVGKVKHVDVKPSEDRDRAYLLESYGPVVFEYRTATCPGSSGAPILHLCLPITIRNGDMTSVTRRPVCADGWIHSGALGRKKSKCNCFCCPNHQVNYSCIVNCFNPYWKLQSQHNSS